MSDQPLGLYGIADTGYGDPVEAATLLLEAGVKTVQLRAKNWTAASVAEVAATIHQRCLDANAAFIVNDHVEIAAKLGTSGLHLGQDDMPIAEARRQFNGRIGISTHDLAQVRRANADGADYIGFGPVFQSGTRQLKPPLGLDALKAAVQASEVPVVAIGGIGLADVRAVLETGARSWAIIGAIFGSENPRQVLGQLMTFQSS